MQEGAVAAKGDYEVRFGVEASFGLGANKGSPSVYWKGERFLQ